MDLLSHQRNEGEWLQKRASGYGLAPDTGKPGWCWGGAQARAGTPCPHNKSVLWSNVLNSFWIAFCTFKALHAQFIHFITFRKTVFGEVGRSSKLNKREEPNPAFLGRVSSPIYVSSISVWKRRGKTKLQGCKNPIRLTMMRETCEKWEPFSCGIIPPGKLWKPRCRRFLLDKALEELQSSAPAGWGAGVLFFSRKKLLPKMCVRGLKAFWCSFTSDVCVWTARLESRKVQKSF